MFRGDTQYIGNLKDATRKLLELNNSKVAGYRINTHKSAAFLYVNNKRSKEKLRKQSHLLWHQKE